MLTGIADTLPKTWWIILIKIYILSELIQFRMYSVLNMFVCLQTVSPLSFRQDHTMLPRLDSNFWAYMFLPSQPPEYMPSDYLAIHVPSCLTSESTFLHQQMILYQDVIYRQSFLLYSGYAVFKTRLLKSLCLPGEKQRVEMQKFLWIMSVSSTYLCSEELVTLALGHSL